MIITLLNNNNTYYDNIMINYGYIYTSFQNKWLLDENRYCGRDLKNVTLKGKILTKNDQLKILFTEFQVNINNIQNSILQPFVGTRKVSSYFCLNLFLFLC